MQGITTGVHLHVHSEDSLLDGASTVKQLVEKAVSLGHKALGITDHGVCSAIPDFIKECNKQGIKPIPGCEVYVTKDRLVQGKELEEMRKEICIKYKITDKKGKPKMKVLNDFIRAVRKSPKVFNEQATHILKDYLMSFETPEEDAQIDLFSDEFEFDDPFEEQEEVDPIEAFRKDIYNYLAHGSFHMVLLAINNQGLEDLYKIVSDAHLNGFYSDPRTDLKFIRENGLGKNIIATSACLGSYLSHLIMTGQKEKAIEHINECKETFYAFYLEKQATHIPEQMYVNRELDELAKITNTEKILTTDVHYANKEDYKIHDILVASSTGKCINDEDRMKYAHEFWMKSDEEMLRKCNDPEAWANTAKIADIVNVSLPEKPLFPEFPFTGDEPVEELLRKKAWNGLFRFALTDNIDIHEYSRRLQYELDVICSMGFADYFLIEEDMIRATNEAGYITGPGRGSAAGSLVAYCLGITSVDPVKYGLLFERFLNPERAGYPDIDTDFSYVGSRWVYNYLKDRYGEDKIAQIGTKGTMAARAVCRKVGKTLGYDLKVQDAFAKAIPGRPGIKLSEAYAEEEMVRQYAEAYPEWWKAMVALEGHLNSLGVHASGVVISPVPITNVTPLRKDKQGVEVTQYDMEWIEKLLVKFDILKLDTLDLIKQTLEYAGLWGKIDIYRDIDINDPRIYTEIYQKLNLSGIFQCESDLYRDIIEKMKPTCFEDISVIVALGRPGPLDLIPSYINRKHGREKVTYPFPEVEDILKETYGIYVYQEQIMKMSQVLGGLTLGQADMIRKGIAKKKEDLMNRWLDLMIYGSKKYKETHAELVKKYPKKENIPLNSEGKPSVWVDYDWEEQPDNIEGAINRGFDLDKLMKVKKDWIKFGEYCFNKSHSVAYAYLSVITAWLKLYYPSEFMAALMTISEGKKDKHDVPKNVHYMNECEEMGIRILPPDVNLSLSGWTPKRYETPVQDKDKTYIGEIRYGLSSIAKISDESVDEIINNRPYNSVEDLIQKTNGTKINKTKVEALIKSGSFDSINSNRNQLLRNYFKSRGEEYNHIPENTVKADIISYEKEYLGTSVSVRSRWERVKNGAQTQITGHVMFTEKWKAKSSGKEHYMVTLETNEEPIQVIVWGYLMKKYKDSLEIGNKVCIKGEKSNKKLIAKSVKLLENLNVVMD